MHAIVSAVGWVMLAGPTVHGAFVGRNVLYPGDGDPLAIGEAAGGIVHGALPVERTLDAMAACRGRDMDWITRYPRG